MRVGPKRYRAEFYRRDVTGDTFGDSRGTDTWTLVSTEWVDIMPLRGEEHLAAQQLKDTLSHRVRARWSSTLATITPKHQMRMGSRTFDIVSVMDVGERLREIELMVVERF